MLILKIQVHNYLESSLAASWKGLYYLVLIVGNEVTVEKSVKFEFAERILLNQQLKLNKLAGNTAE